MRVVVQGLFERHKLIVATQLAMLVLRTAGELSAQKFDFLLRGPQRAGVSNPIVEWLPDSVWASVQALKVDYCMIIKHLCPVPSLYSMCACKIMRCSYN